MAYRATVHVRFSEYNRGLVICERFIQIDERSQHNQLEKKKRSNFKTCRSNEAKTEKKFKPFLIKTAVITA